MKELAPASAEGAMLVDRLVQFPRALDHIAIGERLIAEYGPSGVYSESPDGKGSVVFDAQVLRGMKGAALGIYTELVAQGFKEEADSILKEKRGK